MTQYLGAGAGRPSEDDGIIALLGFELYHPMLITASGAGSSVTNNSRNLRDEGKRREKFDFSHRPEISYKKAQ